MAIEKGNHDCEIVTAEFEGTAYRFDVDELCSEFFGGIRVPDEVLQEHADILAANTEIPGYDGDDVVSLDRENFNDSYGDMMADLREDFVKKLVKREKALYAIALECFNELCSGMAPESIRKRLDDAIENTIKEQA